LNKPFIIYFSPGALRKAILIASLILAKGVLMIEANKQLSAVRGILLLAFGSSDFMGFV